jgi:hypothetical protein
MPTVCVVSGVPGLPRLSGSAGAGHDCTGSHRFSWGDRYMKRIITRNAAVLSALTVLLSTAVAGAQMMGYPPMGNVPAQGYMPQPMYGPANGAPVVQAVWGGGPNEIGLVQGVQAEAQKESNGTGCSDGSCGHCGGGRGGCSGGGCGLMGGRLFGGSSGCDPCGSCNGAGCGGCGGSGCLGDHGAWPGGSGQCCYPRWFDVAIDTVLLKRDNLPRNLVLSKFGVGGFGGVALETDDFGSFDFKPGFRATATRLVGAGTNVEVTYLGAFNWASTATVRENNNLYSVLSEYGFLALPDGYAETDVADKHSIAYSTNLNSLEVNLRRRWVAPSCRLHSSMLMGIRYVRLEEDFDYRTRVRRPDAFSGLPVIAGMDYLVKTKNDMLGYQLGGELYGCITPSVGFSADLKAGIYGNHARQKTSSDSFLVGDAPRATFLESDGVTSVALVSEATLKGYYKVTSRLTLRCGYRFLYLSSVALASENFNTVPSSLTVPEEPRTRITDINNGGYAFYHGFDGGFEWTW